MHEILEFFRASLYLIGTVTCMYVTIECANRGAKAMAGVMGTLCMLHGALFLSVVSRFFGLSDVASRTLITPAVFVHVVSILTLIWRDMRDRKNGSLFTGK